LRVFKPLTTFFFVITKQDILLTFSNFDWDSKVKGMILSTNSEKIGVLPNHVPIATTTCDSY
jgi:hypothetical protein